MKKAVTFTINNFIALAIASILAIIIINLIFTSCHSIGAGVYSSFITFSETLDKVAKDLQLNQRQTNIILFEDDAIIGFAKDVQYIKLNTAEHKLIFKKPESKACEKTACLCLCQDGLGTDDNAISCKGKIKKCLDISKFDIKKKIESEDKTSSVENGFIIFGIEDKLKSMPVYIKTEQKEGKTLLSVCQYSDCSLILE